MVYTIVSVNMSAYIEMIEEFCDLDDFAPRVNSGLKRVVLECYSQSLRPAIFAERIKWFLATMHDSNVNVEITTRDTLDSSRDSLENMKYLTSHHSDAYNNRYFVFFGFILTKTSMGQTRSKSDYCIVQNEMNVLMNTL